MLNVLEKVVIVVAIICGIVTLIPYMLGGGIPSTRPAAFVPAVRPAATPARAPVKPGDKPAPPPKVLTQSDKDIIDALKTQNPRLRGGPEERL